jgi:acetyl-CoA carboxylase biotin carboxyl carrier protein
MSEESASAKAKTKESSSSRKKNEPAAASLNMEELRELAELVNEHGFTDFEFENENIRVRLSKMTAPPVIHATPAAVAPQYSSAPASAPAGTPAQSAAEMAAPAADEDAGLHKITSPIVGTFYRSPGPDKEPYVKEGSKVSAESVVCIVEAMKLMNEIQAEVSGEIVKIYVENGEPVEFGQPLFGVRK